MASLITYPALFLSFAFGVIGMSVGINALIESNNLKDFVQEHAPQGVIVDIDTTEILKPGVVVTVGSGLLALTSFFTVVAYITPFKPVSRRPILIASFAHFFWSTWIFASLVAYDVIARNRDAKVSAFLGNNQLPDSVVRQQEAALGVSRVYWDHDYIRFLAILPWFAILFGVVVGIERLYASKNFELHPSRTAAGAVDAEVGGGALGPAETRETETGKASVEKRESVDSPQ